MTWLDLQDGLASLFDQGGATLWAILVSSILLWILIIERYWFHLWELPTLRDNTLKTFRAHRASLDKDSIIRRIDALVEDIKAESRRNMLALNALTAILPLLGLLGTVSGMIKVFDVITVFGTGNTRGMASGISEALVTTMAGLFTALSGIYFVSDLDGRAEEAARRLEADLVESG